MTFISVTDIVNFRPLQAIVGTEEELIAEVVPANATNQTIEWSLVSGNATIRRNGNRAFLTAHTSELITVRATVRNGVEENTPPTNPSPTNVAIVEQNGEILAVPINQQ